MARGLTRRSIIAAVCAAAWPLRFVRADRPAKKLPRVLYASDTTNILSCISPWHAAGQPLEPRMFTACVDEAVDAGADAFVFQPGLGWNAWWPSTVEPIAELVKWYEQTYLAPAKLSAFQCFVLEGGDFVKLTVDHCRQRGVMPIVSFRLNDAHHKASGVIQITRPQLDHVGREYLEHPEHRLGRIAGEPSYVANLDNWALEGPREFKLKLIGELIANYDLAGVELDFMRHPFYFRPQMPVAERRAIMTGFVAQVRKMLRPDQLLVVRIPSRIDKHDVIGCDPRKFVEAGVDVFDLSSGYETQQQTDLAAIRQSVGPLPGVYMEMQSVIAVKGPSDLAHRRRTTVQQMTTAAHLAYARGASGVALFNFQYYRPTVHEDDGPYSEPPFEVIKLLKDPAALASLPQHYLVGVSQWKGGGPFPRAMKTGDTAVFAWDMAPRKSGAKLRVQAEKSLGDSRWRAVINGKRLEPTVDVSEPFENRYTQLLGQPEEHRAWAIPAEVLIDGINRIEITLEQGDPATLVMMDVAVL
jgi:hypothetical protein